MAVLLIILWLAITSLSVVAANQQCQRVSYLKSEYGTINEPLYPDASIHNDVGLRSCWFFNHSLEEDYMVGVEIKNIDVAGTRYSSFWFSDYSKVFRKKREPYCFLYRRGNNTCSAMKSKQAMESLMPNCRDHMMEIDVTEIPSFIVLSSNVIDDWKSKKMNFEIDYRFLPCGVTIDKPDEEKVKPSSVQPCNRNGTFDKFKQEAPVNLMPVVIALSVALAITLFILIMVILRLRRSHHLKITENEQTAPLHIAHFENGRQASKIVNRNGMEFQPQPQFQPQPFQPQNGTRMGQMPQRA